MYVEMRKYFPIYEEGVDVATAPFRISLYSIWGKFDFLFYRCTSLTHGEGSVWFSSWLDHSVVDHNDEDDKVVTNIGAIWPHGRTPHLLDRTRKQHNSRNEIHIRQQSRASRPSRGNKKWNNMQMSPWTRWLIFKTKCLPCPSKQFLPVFIQILDQSIVNYFQWKYSMCCIEDGKEN